MGVTSNMGSDLQHAAQAALRMRAGRPQGILPDQLASGLMAFYSTQLRTSEHRAFFELLTSAFGVQRALTRPTLARIAFRRQPKPAPLAEKQTAAVRYNDDESPRSLHSTALRQCRRGGG